MAEAFGPKAEPAYSCDLSKLQELMSVGLAISASSHICWVINQPYDFFVLTRSRLRTHIPTLSGSPISFLIPPSHAQWDK